MCTARAALPWPGSRCRPWTAPARLVPCRPSAQGRPSSLIAGDGWLVCFQLACVRPRCGAPRAAACGARPESDEERELRERIAALRARAEAGEADAPAPPRAAAANGAAPDADPASEAAEPPVAAAESEVAGEPASADASAAEPGGAGAGAGAEAAQGEGGVGEGEAAEGGAPGPARTVAEELGDLEAALERLSTDLDDQVRFSRVGGRRDNW